MLVKSKGYGWLRLNENSLIIFLIIYHYELYKVKI
nr:MAG TPA: hypothetical protein [Caudoviricetes sp.]